MSDEAANPFSTEIQRSAEATVVRCHGALVTGTSNILQREVKELIGGSAKIVLDLKDLTYIDSMGIGSLVRLYVSAKSSGCSLQLINISGRVQQVLGITNLLTVFGTAEDHNLPVH
jgi:anti-sigma B factor antagonist